MKSLEMLERITSKLAPGPLPTFRECHVVKALEIISDGELIGRGRLSSMLGLGQGAVRTLLSRIESEGLTETSKKGISLTKLGHNIFEDLRSRITKTIEVPKSPLAVGAFNVAVLVKGGAPLIKLGIEQRDAAIKEGAIGAATLTFSHGKLTLPKTKENISIYSDNLRLQEVLMSKLKPQENDVIIIAYGNDLLTAEWGAKSAGLALIKLMK